MPDNEEVVYQRSDKVAYMGLTLNATTFKRMIGFTSMGNTLNTKTYSRQYVDESTEREDVTGYAKKIAYGFDRFSNNDVHEFVANVHDLEQRGIKVPIVIVDFNKPDTTSGTYYAIKKVYSIIPDGDGDGTDAYQYSGNFSSAGTLVEGLATVSADGKTCSFTENTPSNS
jgi:hypothetical protein